MSAIGGGESRSNLLVCLKIPIAEGVVELRRIELLTSAVRLQRLNAVQREKRRKTARFSRSNDQNRAIRDTLRYDIDARRYALAGQA